MRITVADAISPSYFVAIAAVQLGFFQEEGVEMEFVFPPADPSQALRDGVVDFYGGSPYAGLHRFPGWRGGAVLCALSHYTYWFLAVRSDLKSERGDVNAVKGLRLSASVLPGLTMKRLLEESGIDLQRDNVRIVASPRRTSQNWAWDGVDALERGVADGYWGNGLRAAGGSPLDVPGAGHHGPAGQGASRHRRGRGAGNREDPAGPQGRPAAGRAGRATAV